jgi:hypothetical protein
VAALAALGLVALANSRPYEGAVTAAVAGGALWIWRRRSRRPFGELLAPRVALPAAAILGCGLAAMLYYNYRVTGHALLMPYALHQAQYGASPIFWMMPLGRPPVYRHEVIRRFWEMWDLPYYNAARSFPPHVALSFLIALQYFLTPVSAMALFAAVFLRCGRKVRIALSIAGVATAGLLLERYSNPHYFAPATGLVLLLVMLGAQYLKVKFGYRVFGAFVVLFFAVAAIQASRLTVDEYPHKLFVAHRGGLIHRLESASGRHLVLVRYAPDHNVMEEWVYNHADIDGSAIVWARDMGDAANRELLDYFRGRQVWLVEADAPDPQPVPYSPR